jgi:hypothetical protein
MVDDTSGRPINPSYWMLRYKRHRSRLQITLIGNLQLGASKNEYCICTCTRKKIITSTYPTRYPEVEDRVSDSGVCGRLCGPTNRTVRRPTPHPGTYANVFQRFLNNKCAICSCIIRFQIPHSAKLPIPFFAPRCHTFWRNRRHAQRRNVHV